MFQKRPGGIPGLLLGLGLLLSAGSCSHLGYYARSAAGGLQLLFHRRPIAAVLADPDTPPDLAQRLRRVQEIRSFASRELHLPEDRSYTGYTHLDREAAVWTVVAAPELSVEPLEWCFLFVGCVSYRGYFSEQAARRFASRLEAEGHDVVVDGRLAYSTLGWFADPVLSTFVFLPEPELAGLLFHELAHRRVFVRGDTAFNESFATVVELAGVERWLRSRGRGVEIAPYRKRQQRQRRVTDLLLATRERLDQVFSAARPEGWKRRRKEEILDRLRARLLPQVRIESIEPLNNARLASVGAYHRWVGAFERLLDGQGGDLPAFYREVEALARLPASRRHDALDALLSGRPGS